MTDFEQLIYDFYADKEQKDYIDWSRKDARYYCKLKIGLFKFTNDDYKAFEKAFNKLIKEGKLVATRTVTASNSYVKLYKLVNA